MKPEDRFSAMLAAVAAVLLLAALLSQAGLYAASSRPSFRSERAGEGQPLR
ncbi:hypothetical protein [Paenibacillus herberti]|nr:hypothetical protein [Paenibacillus herberti]